VHVQTNPGVNLTEDDVVVHATRIDFTLGKDNPVSSRYDIQSQPCIFKIGLMQHDFLESVLHFPPNFPI